MSVSVKHIQMQLQKTRIYIDQLRELLDERKQLVRVLQLSPSNADNMDVINLLAKIKAGLNYARADLQSGISKDLSQQLSEAIATYSEIIEPLHEDPYLNVDEYLYKQEASPDDEPNETGKKSVRFKDYASDENEDETTHMRNQLMGTSSNFKPYRDAEVDSENRANDGEYDTNGDEGERNTLLSIDSSNQEMFALHQQQMLEQDQSLDELHKSVTSQHRMGININEELDEHLIILNDLEQGVDGSHRRIRRATNGIANFRRKVQENGSLATIIVLTVILILLLVVLN